MDTIREGSVMLLWWKTLIVCIEQKYLFFMCDVTIHTIRARDLICTKKNQSTCYQLNKKIGS